MTKKDDWIRDELILAFDMCLRQPEVTHVAASPEIVELADQCRKLHVLLVGSGATPRRDPGAVAAKVRECAWIVGRSEADNAGLRDGDALRLWSEFALTQQELRQIAAAIRDSLAPEAVPADAWREEADIETALEGRVLTRLHRYRDRDARLAKLKKDRVLLEKGKLACEACGQDAAERYGQAGAGVIDVHHTKPLHTLAEPTETTLADLALLCATCHRVLHAASDG